MGGTPGVDRTVAGQGRAAGGSMQRAITLLGAHPLVDGHNDLPIALRKQAGYDFEALDWA